MSTDTRIGGHAATHPSPEFYFISVDLDDGRPCPPVFEVGFCWQIVARDVARPYGSATPLCRCGHEPPQPRSVASASDRGVGLRRRCLD
jgi:hypothetical protein